MGISGIVRMTGKATKFGRARSMRTIVKLDRRRPKFKH